MPTDEILKPAEVVIAQGREIECPWAIFRTRGGKLAFDPTQPNSQPRHHRPPACCSTRAKRASNSTVSMALRLVSSTPVTTAASSGVISPSAIAVTVEDKAAQPADRFLEDRDRGVFQHHHFGAALGHWCCADRGR